MPLAADKQKLKDVLKEETSADELLDQLFEALEPTELEILFQNIRRVYEQEPVSQGSAQGSAHIFQTREYSKKERIGLEFATLYRYFERRRGLLESALSPTQVGKLLNVTRQTAHDRREAGTMLGVLDNGVWRYPTWQFDPEGPNGVVDGLPDVLKALKVSELAKVSWLTRTNPVLENTPIEALKQGRKKEVLTEALAVGVT